MGRHFPGGIFHMPYAICHMKYGIWHINSQFLLCPLRRELLSWLVSSLSGARHLDLVSAEFPFLWKLSLSVKDKYPPLIFPSEIGVSPCNADTVQVSFWTSALKGHVVSRIW